MGRGRSRRTMPASMLARVVLFFLGAWLLSRVLAHVPLVGPLFARTGWIGIWLAAMLLSFALTRLGERAAAGRRDGAELRRLAAVDSAHNHGKSGTLLASRRRWKAALVHLERAAQGEPEVAEWQYKKGVAELALRRPERARASFQAALAIDPEHAFGDARMRLAEAALACGDAQASLAALETLERNHGPSPESAFRRARAARALGRPELAREALAELEELASAAPRWQRGTAERWRWKGRLARLLG